ncbi:hypothetical protein SAMN04515647_1192 [Cohaesibacter sp. ES.047]|nr:hypothetical protein SAMN04515647_1192 [Cohaesibacter sp. ES.047]
MPCRHLEIAADKTSNPVCPSMPSSPKPEKMDLSHQPTTMADAKNALNSAGRRGQPKNNSLTVTSDWAAAFEVTEEEIQLILNHLDRDLQRIMGE